MYLDDSQQEQGPFDEAEIAEWHAEGLVPDTLPLRAVDGRGGGGGEYAELRVLMASGRLKAREP